MQSDPLGTQMQLGWLSQQTTVSGPLVPSLLRRVARQRQWRSRLDRASAILLHGALALYFSAAAVFGEVLLCRIGSAFFAAGLFYSLYRFLCAAAFSSLPPDAAGMECVEFYRRQLVQRRDAVKNYLHWGVLPAIPGALLATLGWIIAEPRDGILAIGIFAFFLGMQYVTLQHCNQSRTQLQKEIDLLEPGTGPRS